MQSLCHIVVHMPSVEIKLRTMHQKPTKITFAEIGMCHSLWLPYLLGVLVEANSNDCES